jgi:RNA polymerase sigma-70 factor (ECF subfamily)
LIHQAARPQVALNPEVQAMNPPGSVTRMIPRLRSDDPGEREEAARLIWRRYFPALLGLARGHLSRRVRRREDEEDVLQSMFASFCRRQARGDFDLRGRDALWALLVTITLRKARNAANRHRCAARDCHREQEAPPGDGGECPAWALGQMEASGPTPAEAAALSEELERRLQSLADPTLLRIALLRLEGHTSGEIAAALSCVERTVERKLERIRDRWTGGNDLAPRVQDTVAKPRDH